MSALATVVAGGILAALTAAACAVGMKRGQQQLDQLTPVHPDDGAPADPDENGDEYAPGALNLDPVFDEDRAVLRVRRHRADADTP